jgi:hypothetical protein
VAVGDRGRVGADVDPRSPHRFVRETGDVSVDWSGSPDDPHGYFKLRDFLIETSDRLALLGESWASERLRDAGESVGLPSEFMGEAGLALRDALTLSNISPTLTADMESALEAIRQGFRAVGTDPIF